MVMKQVDKYSFFTSSDVEIRKSSAFLLPSEYKIIILNIEEKIHNILKDNLLLFSLVGSCQFETCIPKWSDIDILIIVKKLNKETMLFLNQQADLYRYHIGISVFSQKSIETCSIDFKTQLYLYQMKFGRIKPQFFSEDLTIIVEDIEKLIKDAIVLEKENIFALRRNIYYKSPNIKLCFKLIINILKDELLKKYIICSSLNDVWKYSLSILNINLNDYIKIENIPFIKLTNLIRLGEFVLNKYE